MAKMKKVSIRSIEEAVEGKTQDTTTVEFNGLEINVKRILPFYDMIRFVRDVVSGCFADETGRYMPEVFPFMIRLCVLAYYTNVNIPQKVEKQYELSYTTGLYETIIDNIDKTQFNDICNAIYNSIEHSAEANINEIHTQFISIQSTFRELVEQFKEVFSGIDTNELKNVIDSITDRGIDEGKLIRAYIDNKNGFQS